MMADSDVKRVLEMLHLLQVDIAVIKATVGKLDHAVHGNGKPGLLDRMIVIETTASTAGKAYTGILAVGAFLISLALAVREFAK
jgi:hypothetical protein